MQIPLALVRVPARLSVGPDTLQIKSDSRPKSWRKKCFG
jgi:hypothetical protein